MKTIAKILIVVLLLITLYKLFDYAKKHSSHKAMEFFDKGHPVIDELKNTLKHVHPEFSKIRIVVGDQSYTLNKEKVFLCLHDKKTGKLYDKNMLTYVLLHEMAHVLNKEDEGHTPAFHKKFDQLLDIATKKGIYDPNIPLVEDYCPES